MPEVARVGRDVLGVVRSWQDLSRSAKRYQELEGVGRS